MPHKDPVFVLCDQIRETTFALHKYLKHGHLERVYQNGLAHRLRKQGLKVTTRYPLSVFDEDGTDSRAIFCRPVHRLPFDHRTQGLPCDLRRSRRSTARLFARVSR